MNERIKLLALQSDVTVLGTISGGKQYTFLEQDLARFAELIVQECIQAIQNEGQTYEHLDAGEFQAILLSAAANVLKETK